MFRKEISVKAQCLLKKSDKKKLVGQISKFFRDEAFDDINRLMPIKDDMTLMKVKLHSGENVDVYAVENVPMFFMVQDYIYPTVYALWKCPDIVAYVETHPSVLKHLKNGADLMLPGVNREMKSLPEFAASQGCSVRISGNKAAAAVGRTVVSSADMMARPEAQGKAVAIIHCYEDHLWSLGTKLEHPNIPYDPIEIHQQLANLDLQEVSETETMNKPNGDKDDDRGAVEPEDEILEEEKETNQLNSKESMDNLLMDCFLYTLKREGKKLKLPILTSTFYKNHMMTYCPQGHSLEIKKSSYKKMLTFLSLMQQQGLIGLETKGDISVITSVDTTHDKLREFHIPDWKLPEREDFGQKIAEYEPPVINIIYSVTAAVLPLFKMCLPDCNKKDTFYKSQVVQIIQSYAKGNNLQHNELITIDPLLGSVVLNRNENDTTMHVKDVVDRVLKKMSIGYEKILFGGKAENCLGTPKMIEIEKHRKASKKIVTSVKNLEFYGLDMERLTTDLRRELSCSVSSDKVSGVVNVQGDQTATLKRHLMGQYKIPEKYIVVK